MYPSILLIDGNKDDMAVHRRTLEVARTKCSVIPVNDLETAAKMFTSLEEKLLAIIIDGAVPLTFGDIEIATEFRLTSVPFIQAARNSGFSGLMVAACNNQDYRVTMVQYGCSCAVPKDEAAQVVIDWLRNNY